MFYDDYKRGQNNPVLKGKCCMKKNKGKKNNDQGSNTNPGLVYYEIKVQGQLDPLWSRWFEGMTLTHTGNGENEVAYTLISGPVIDQPALHGLLTKIRDLNLTLISVCRIVPGTNIVEEIPIKPDPSGDQDD